MIRKFLLPILIVAWLPTVLDAQEKPEPLRFRAVLHDPVRPIANLFYRDPEGAVAQVNFMPKALTETLFTLPVDGSLVLYDKAEIDPENPAADVAASVRIPSSIKQAIIVVLPAPDDGKLPYRLLVIDDSKRAFPKGESRVIPLIGTDIGVQAGEHTLRVRPGKISTLPPVKKVNDFNMAQTNFYYEAKDGSWTVFTERQLQFLDAFRRLFIVHATPGAVAPTVTTIVDTAAPR